MPRDKKWLFLNFRASKVFFEMYKGLVKVFSTKKRPGLQNERVRINVPPTPNNQNVILAFFGNICVSLLNNSVPCCPEITTPLLVGDIFSKSMKEAWFCYGKVSNVSVVMSQNDSEPFRPISATPGRFSIFLSFQKKHFFGGILLVTFRIVQTILIVIWFLFKISKINFPL